MSTFNRRWTLARAAALALAVLPLTVRAQWKENFDKETVGQFPSTWEAYSQEPVPRTVVVTNNIPDTAPGAKVLKVSHDGKSDKWGVMRPFDRVNLDPYQTIEWGFKVRVARLPSGPSDSPGFFFILQNRQTGLTFCAPRILTASGGSKWTLPVPDNPDSEYPQATKDLRLNKWYSLRFVIETDSDEELKGKACWYLDDLLVNTEAFSNVPEAASALDFFTVRPVTVPQQPGETTIYLDGLYVISRPRKAAGPSK